MDGLAGERISGQFDCVATSKNARLTGKSLSSQAGSNDGVYGLLREGKIDEAASEIVSIWNKSPVNAANACSKLGIAFDPDAVNSNVHTALTDCLSTPNPFQWFYLRTRTRREIARSALNMGSKIRNFTFPYLDPDLTNFLTSMPMNVTQRYGFHTEVIKCAYPESADIPFAESSFQPESRARKRIIQAARMRVGYALSSGLQWKIPLRNPVWWQLSYCQALKKIQLMP
jgi:hypothetical protein